MAQLVDQFNRPIPPSKARAEIAGPDIAKFRQMWTGWYQSTGLTPERLGQVMRTADSGYETPWLHLVEELEEKDSHLASVLGTRKRAVSQLPITVNPASDAPEHEAHANCIRDWIKTRSLELAIPDLMDAVFKSFSVCEIEWDCRPDRVWPHRLIYRPQRWFGIDRLDGDTVMLRDGMALEPLAPWKFTVHKHRFKSGSLIRSGLARPAAWLWMFKAFTMRDWATFVQNYGSPLRLGKYGPEATERDKEALWEAVRDIAGDTAAIMPRSTEIEFVAPKEGDRGGMLFQQRATWMNYEISKLILGQTTTTDAVAGGHAVSQEHEKVREDIERADGVALSVTLTRQLITRIIDSNFGPQAEYPVVLIGRPDEVPLEVVIKAIKELGPMGLEVEAEAVRQRIGMSKPEAGAETIGGKSAAPAPPVAPPAPAGADKVRAFTASLKGALKQDTHSERSDPDMIDRLTDRLARDASGALAGLTDQVREALEGAVDLHDAARRLADLDLDKDAFVVAMTRGMALAHLAGQAALVDELGL